MLTGEQLGTILSRPGYSLASGIPPAKPKSVPRPHDVSPDKAAPCGSARVAVIVTRCSTGRLDRDNLWASAKAIVDGLRDSGYIAGDTEDHIQLIVLQKRVRRADIGTLIQIVTLPPQ